MGAWYYQEATRIRRARHLEAAGLASAHGQRGHHWRMYRTCLAPR